MFRNECHAPIPMVAAVECDLVASLLRKLRLIRQGSVSDEDESLYREVCDYELDSSNISVSETEYGVSMTNKALSDSV